MIKIELNNKKLLIIPVSKEAKNFTLINSHSYFSSPRIEHSIGGVDLDGKIEDYKIINTLSKITEEQCREYVEMRKIKKSFDDFISEVFINYPNIGLNDKYLDSAKESFVSFLKAKKIFTKSIFGEINHENYTTTSAFEMAVYEYNKLPEELLIIEIL